MRMNFQHLRTRTHLMYMDAMGLGVADKPVPGTPELRLSYEEFMDLKADIEFVNQFHWGSMQSVPMEFMCNGVKCIVEIKR